MNTGTIEFDTKVVAALVGALATVSIFFIGKFIELIVNLRNRKIARSRMLNALYTEIAHNVEEMAIAFQKRFIPMLKEQWSFLPEPPSKDNPPPSALDNNDDNNGEDDDDENGRGKKSKLSWERPCSSPA